MMEAATGATKYDHLLEEYCSTREISARNALLEHYGYIAEIAAKKFVGRGVDYDDLYQVASLALLRSLERFDCHRGVKFGSFAMPSVIGEIKNHFRDRSRAIRLPRRAGEMMKALATIQEELTVRLGHPPRPEDIATEMGLSLDQVYEIMEVKNSLRVLSLDETAPGRDGEEGLSLGDLLGSGAEEYNIVDNRDFIENALKLLSPQEQEVLMRRFVSGESQRTIAEAFGVSQMYISRMERRMLQRLRSYLAAD